MKFGTYSRRVRRLLDKHEKSNDYIIFGLSMLLLLQISKNSRTENKI